MVLVPQSMSYATVFNTVVILDGHCNRDTYSRSQLCHLNMAFTPPSLGLCCIVCVLVRKKKHPRFTLNPRLQFFATSKDIAIGPVAVMSLQVSQVIKYIEDKHPDEWSGPQIATNLAFVCGFIVLGIGLLRLGWVVELIPIPAVAGFMTGSAINITVGQIPGLMGISGFEFVFLSWRSRHTADLSRNIVHGPLPTTLLSILSRALVGQPRMLPSVLLASFFCMLSA